MNEVDTLKAYAAKAAPVCGWPKWTEDDGMSLWLSRGPGQLHFINIVGDQLAQGIGRHEAIVLWREHVERWLVRRGCFIGRSQYETHVDWPHPLSRFCKKNADHDAALLAAVKAIGKDVNANS